ncbi:MAG: N-acetyltransferase DgcN [Sneathiellaceae bacterium]
MEKPYLLFLGDAHDQLAAKTAAGIVHWRPEWCAGQLRLEGCKADVGLPDITIAEAKAKGVRTMVIGVVSSGGALPDSWVGTILEAMEAGFDIASGLHKKLSAIKPVVDAATRLGRNLYDVRHPTQDFATGKGRRRSGKRLLTVGTDCSVGKKYTVLCLEKALTDRGMKADFRATGQTGIFIAGRGIPLDAVIADFISGAVEWLTPDNDPDHWDLIEGQGSLFHPAFAGVSLGLLHGAAPDALVLCHEPTRTHMRGLPHYPIPDLQACMAHTLACARLTAPEAKFVGAAVDTHNLPDEAAARACLKDVEARTGLPATDPVRFGVEAIVDNLPG